MKKYILFLSVMVGGLLAQNSLAAQIFFGANQKEVDVGATFQVGAFVHTQGQNINAVEGQIVFPASNLELKGFYTGTSTLTFWVQQPTALSPGVVSFSGVAPGGFTGEKGYLFSIIFKASKSGSVTIATDQEQVLLNDGNGSAASLTKAPLAITIVEPKAAAEPKAAPANDPAPAFVPLYDPDPPEAFEPQIAMSPSIFEGQWFLTFATQDKGSGIDHYEVREAPGPRSFNSLFSKSQFVVGETPYLLKDQSLKSVITVKAIDKANNEQIAVVQPVHGPAWYENYLVWIIIVVMVLIAYILRAFLWKNLVRKLLH